MRGGTVNHSSAPRSLRAARSARAHIRITGRAARRKAGTVLALLLATVVVTAAPPTAARPGGSSRSGRPHTAMSHYLKTTNAKTLNRLGCREGRKIHRGGRGSSVIVVLDFGRPMRMHGLWGTSLFGTSFRSTERIRLAAQAYGRGFSRCLGERHPAHLRVAIGTSNFGRGVTFRHGTAWASMVNRANAWAEEHGYAGRVDFAGANDIELGWNGPRTTRGWVAGYDAAARWPYYDYGDAGGCPPRGNCLGAWTLEDVWYVAWGSPSAWPLPEIYTPTGSQARQWYHLSLYSYQRHGVRMGIAGVLSQRTACRQSSDPCRGMNNSPDRAWSQLHTLLNRDPRTAQALPWSTDMRWQP